VNSQAGQQLVDDHERLHLLLEQLNKALRERDSDIARSTLDLFWARLAVHIRAEHLRLFPAVINTAAPVVAQLREDHEFFMHELASAISRFPDLDQVLIRVKAVEERLAVHNELEEREIYALISSILSPEEQAKLASQVDEELMKRPPRFTAGTWVDDA
jgi:hemerythrin-like domain-containing protein